MLALVLALLADQDWVYLQGTGFVNSSTMEKKSADEFFQHALQLPFLAAYPFRRNAAVGVVHHALWKVNHPVEPWLETLPTPNLFIYH